MLKNSCIAIALVLGAAAIANGVFMLIDPERWYLNVPGVTTTGPFNQHFVRDIGLIFLFLGGAFLIGAVRPELDSVLEFSLNLAFRPRALSFLGSGRRHLWTVRPCTRFPGGNAAGPSRFGDHGLGNRRYAQRV